VYSYTQPRENIIQYQPWYLKQSGNWQPRQVAEGKRHGKGVVARLADCTDRDQALSLMDVEIGISREQLPDPAPGEYYWGDLQGLEVVNQNEESFGRVDHLIETGANDVLVVKGERERLIPFVLEQVVTRVDLDAGVIQVDWDKDF
jgi:16S rRNA processing protein RimM